MDNYKHVVIFVTATSNEEAQKIVKVLLDKRKAACVNIVSGLDSHFWWQGKIDNALEVLLIIKTKASVLREAVDIIQKVHSYKVPEIIVLPIIAGHDDYLKWIDSEVRG